MRDIRAYWREIRAIEQSLPQFVWLAHMAGSAAASFIVELSASRAAQLLHAKSHRLATEEEIAAYRAAEEEKRKAAIDASLRQRGIAVVPVPEKKSTDSPAKDGKRAAPKRG